MSCAAFRLPSQKTDHALIAPRYNVKQLAWPDWSDLLSSTRHVYSHTDPWFTPVYERLPDPDGILLKKPLTSLCQFCDCDVSGDLGDEDNEENYPLLPHSQRPQKRSRTDQEAAILLRSAYFEAICPHIHLPEDKSIVLLKHALTYPHDVMAWNITDMAIDKPSLYAFTKTSPTAGKTGTERLEYMTRHVKMMKRHRQIVTESGFDDGAPGDSRQIIWIIIEDSKFIDRDIAAMLQESGINFAYLAFGPTHRYGNAQHNAAYTIIHALSNAETGAYGHGPIIGIDDDAELHEDLMNWLWRIKRVGLWPMGNLGPTGCKCINRLF